ncbi:hypothetical protein EDC01DRAFT_59528 [Geopyxis carbonaria]|nr:hypothetical protein EDC01DRAFT_59528 [Geopyxis carbonaria]
MAFQAPSRALRQHQLSLRPTDTTNQSLGGTSSIPTPDTEEWVVFAPTASSTGVTERATSASNLSTASPAFASHDTIPGTFDDAVAEETDEEDEDASFDCAETDSLQPFRDYYDGPVLLPAHDGLGTFAAASGYRSLEESLRIVATTAAEDGDKTARINKWRLEQSQAVIDEIERATRQRRMSRAGAERGEEELATEEEGEDDAPATPKPAASEAAFPSETFWKRLTRSFIRDIMGIDDTLLEVLFGEALPADALAPPSPTSMPPPSQLRGTAEERLLDRIAKELGELVKLYTPAPAATTTPRNATPQARRLRVTPASPTATSGVPAFSFTPTLPAAADDAHAALWGIEDAPGRGREYWETELDMQVVYSYLKSRFVPPASTTTTTTTTTTKTAAGSTTTAKSTPRHRPAPPPRKSSTASTGFSMGTGMSLVLGMASGGGGGTVASSESHSRRSGYYWDVATSVGSAGARGSCGGTGVWAAI